MSRWWRNGGRIEAVKIVVQAVVYIFLGIFIFGKMIGVNEIETQQIEKEIFECKEKWKAQEKLNTEILVQLREIKSKQELTQTTLEKLIDVLRKGK